MPQEEASIDKDLYDGLQQARKKKPRHFALIGKGVDVVGLIVQKKAITDGQAQKAKSECKGTLVVQGVCRGEGAELIFEVTGAEPSITPKKIKDFIEERTELTLKPQWSVVQAMSAVVDDEASRTSSETAAVGQPTAVPESLQPAPPERQIDIRALQARLKPLLEKYQMHVGANAALRGKLQPIAKAAADLVQAASAEAEAALDRLEKVFAKIEQHLEQSGGATYQTDNRERKQAIELASHYLALLDKLESALAVDGESPVGQTDERECTQAIDLVNKYSALLDKLESALKVDGNALENQTDEREYQQAIERSQVYLSLLEKLNAALSEPGIGNEN